MLLLLIIDRETHCHGHNTSYKRKIICVAIRKFSKKEPQGYQPWFSTVSHGIDLDFLWASSENGHTCVDAQGSPPFWLRDFLQRKTQYMFQYINSSRKNYIVIDRFP
jgi:hypothetical protein